MHFINPFKGLRPTKESVTSIVIPSTDHLSSSDIENIKKNNQWSYLNILNNKNQKEAKEQFELMKKKSLLIKEDNKSFYIYKITQSSHTQIGLIGSANLSAYDNLHIRGHEEIYFDRAQERTEQMLNLNAQIGPIYVIFPDNDILNKLIQTEISLSEPFYSFDSLDNCNHSLWIINKVDVISKITSIFNEINKIYIADGHHRIEAMIKLSEIKKHRNHNHSGSELYNYVMIAAFPQSQSRILDYNRLIKDLYGYSKDNLFHINNLDINLLHYYLLEPILGIGDSRYDKRLDFISGFKGLEAIENKVNSGEAAIGFSLFPTQIEDVITFADKKLTMPPKSTWFDPKPLDGLVTYEFD